MIKCYLIFVSGHSNNFMGIFKMLENYSHVKVEHLYTAIYNHITVINIAEHAYERRVAELKNTIVYKFLWFKITAWDKLIDCNYSYHNDMIKMYPEVNLNFNHVPISVLEKLEKHCEYALNNKEATILCSTDTVAFVQDWYDKSVVTKEWV